MPDLRDLVMHRLLDHHRYEYRPGGDSDTMCGDGTITQVSGGQLHVEFSGVEGMFRIGSSGAGTIPEIPQISGGPLAQIRELKSGFPQIFKAEIGHHALAYPLDNHSVGEVRGHILARGCKCRVINDVFPGGIAIRDDGPMNIRETEGRNAEARPSHTAGGLHTPMIRIDKGRADGQGFTDRHTCGWNIRV